MKFGWETDDPVGLKGLMKYDILVTFSLKINLIPDRKHNQK